MVMVRMEGLSFSYPPLDGTSEQEGCAGTGASVLRGVDLAVAEGAFCVVTGPTGCGKSTLLRLLVPAIAPRGRISGSITVRDVPFVVDGVRRPMDARETTGLVAFVDQDPEAQIVCDSVRAELAFGLENLGMDSQQMGRRIAEAAGFLGIDGWMARRTAELSGGEKQLVNLAAALASRPSVLLLDEPIAQLDPHARRTFLSALGAVNRELGVTVIVTSHAPEELEGLATDAFELGKLPEPAPLVRDAGKAPSPHASASVIELDGIHFRYGKDDPWIVEGIDLAVQAGCIHALVGGNGSGKTTVLKLLAGIAEPQRGRVRMSGNPKRVYLPQDPKALFVCDSVAEELHEWSRRFGYGASEERTMAERFGLETLLAQHPYDLSGGQQQMLALAKLLLTEPRILLLDEPTKGLDALAAASVARTLIDLAADGTTIVVASHDAAFVQVVADRVSLIFDGRIATTATAGGFFKDSLVYHPIAESRLFGVL